MHIVIGVDDSRCSTLAVDFVRGMTWPAGTSATVVCALPPVAAVAAVVPEAYLLMAESLETTHRELRTAHEAHAREVARMLSAAGIRAAATVPDADPRAALIDVAKLEHADLLVVGSHGRTGLPRLVLGSVAAHVTAHAPCSVLVVRGPVPS